VVGPTAVGKSEFALLACERWGGELVSVDSMQVYRGLDLGTGKPGRADRDRVPHHGIDLADAGDDFSLGDFVRAAQRAITAIRGRRRLPVLVGGTGLYLRGLLKGVVDAPRRNSVIRARLVGLAGRRGPAHLHRMLCRVDPEAADRLAPNDRQRIVRALEVYFASRRGLSDWIRESPFGPERYDAIKIGLEMGAEALARRIDARVRAFFAAGLMDEIRGLIASGCRESANALKALGYREGMAYLRGDIGLEESILLTQRNTRRYAKRQRTWFRREEGVTWFHVDPEGPDRFREPLAHVEQELSARGDR
jgi:tRNA dimethylallyltransferase